MTFHNMKRHSTLGAGAKGLFGARGHLSHFPGLAPTGSSVHPPLGGRYPTLPRHRVAKFLISRQEPTIKLQAYGFTRHTSCLLMDYRPL